MRRGGPARRRRVDPGGALRSEKGWSIAPPLSDPSGIGSDLDGGFGTEQTPRDLDTIADLQKLAPLLRRRGYTAADIAAIFHGNWLRFFTEALPPA